MDLLLILSILLAFATSFALVPWWISRAKRAGIVGIDVHKLARPKIAEMGGLPVIVGFLVGVFAYIAVKTFVFLSDAYNPVLFAGIMTILLSAMIGLIDDLLKWRIGLRQWQKPLLGLFAAIPLMVVNAGTTTMNLPLLGLIDLGLIYPLLVIPIIVTGASNAFNMVAGYNGLEAGMGIIILSTLGFIIWQVQGLGQVAMIAAVMVAALLAFIIYNWYPARVFPGDTLTYAVGAAIAVVTILGNVEKFAMILFLPYFIEFFLKARSGWKAQSYSAINKPGSLGADRTHSLGHLFVKGLQFFGMKTSEISVTVLHLLLTGIVGLLALSL